VSGATAESPRPDRLPGSRLRAPGFLSNLARRSATAFIVLPVLLLAFLRGPAWLTVAIVGAFLAVGLFEFFALLRARGIRPMRRVGFVLAAALFFDVVAPGWLGVPFAPLGALLLLTFALWRGADLEAVASAAGTLLGAVYLGSLGGTIAGLRTQPPGPDGAWRFVLLVFILVFSDSFAFLFGNALGRRRLLPGISPGKSVEGALAGLVGGVVGAFLARRIGLPDLPAVHAAGLGVSVAAMGIVGDLEESLLKRWAGVKDSGALFPGHGGMLDRLDSLLFGAPVLYYYFQYVR
jgi:phosphatidate cytidylyltransferase